MRNPTGPNSIIIGAFLSYDKKQFSTLLLYCTMEIRNRVFDVWGKNLQTNILSLNTWLQNFFFFFGRWLFCSARIVLRIGSFERILFGCWRIKPHWPIQKVNWSTIICMMCFVYCTAYVCYRIYRINTYQYPIIPTAFELAYYFRYLRNSAGPNNTVFIFLEYYSAFGDLPFFKKPPVL